MKGRSCLAAMLRPKLNLQEGPTPLVACPCPFPSASPVVEAVLAAAAVVAVGAPLVGGAVPVAAAPAAADAVVVPVAAPLVEGAAPVAAAPAAADVAAGWRAAVLAGPHWRAPAGRTVVGHCAHWPDVRCSAADSVERW